MQKEQTAGQVTDPITDGLELQAIALGIINFVEQQLSAWRDDPNRPVAQAENKLNLQLCKFLDSCARDDFPMIRFDHEEQQSRRRRIDISASPTVPTIIGAKPHSIYDPILVVECKRLPAPSSDREKEYVTGGKDRQSGGIQRFKLGLHGATLNIVAMIGYVQERSLSDWHREINGWIAELCNGETKDGCVWNDDETLVPLAEDAARRVASYRSRHHRSGSVSNNEIAIYHLWIIMNT